jgi:Leucine-rich repeat (LRR) protein
MVLKHIHNACPATIFKHAHDAYSVRLYDQNITDLSHLTLNCIIFECYDTNLERLPNLPYCMYLDCHSCKITELQELPNCVCLDCSYNNIDVIPSLPKAKHVYYNNNPCSIVNKSLSLLDRFINYCVRLLEPSNNKYITLE